MTAERPYGPPDALASASVQPWTPTEAIHTAVERVKADPATILLPLIIAIVIVCLPGAFGGALAGLFGDGLLGTLAQLVAFVAGLAVQSFMTGGIIVFCLHVMRGEEVTLGDVFSGGPYFVQMLLAYLLYGIPVWIGLMLCVLPGWFLAIALFPIFFLVVDRDLNAIDALRSAWEITHGERVGLFVFGLIAIGVLILGVVGCCVGLLVAGPTVLLAASYVYLRLTGQ